MDASYLSTYLSGKRLKTLAGIVCVHAALVYCGQQGRQVTPAATGPARMMTVRLVAMPVTQVAAEPMPPQHVRQPARTMHVAVHIAPASYVRPRSAPTLPDAAPSPAPRDVPAAHTFDMDAARLAARQAEKAAPHDANEGDADRLMTYKGQEKLRQGLERARRGDCRTQYAGMGILAVAPLLVDGVTGRGCQFR